MKEYKELKKLHQRLIQSKKYNFTPKGRRTKVTDEHGVYIIFGPNKEILYVGMTKRAKNGLNQRLNNHRTGASSFST